MNCLTEASASTAARQRFVAGRTPTASNCSLKQGPPVVDLCKRYYEG